MYLQRNAYNIAKLWTIDNAEAQTLVKLIKHDVLKFWPKWRILQRIKMKNLNAKILTRNASFVTPFFDFLFGLRHRNDPLYHI